MLDLLKQDLKPRDIMTYKSFENAIVTVMALGGSTNAVLHLIAMARWVRVGVGGRVLLQWEVGCAEGGRGRSHSTNAVLHLIAMPRWVRVVVCAARWGGGGCGVEKGGDGALGRGGVGTLKV